MAVSYASYKPTAGGSDYPSKINDFMDKVATDMDSRALASDMAALDKTDIGLGNADNTSDADKPVSAAQSTAISTAVSSKQATLVSGTNIKTVNSQSILGSGNIVIEGGTGGGDMYKSTYDPDGDGKIAYAQLSGVAPALGTDDNYLTDAEKTKLGGIAEGANNYTHPASHDPSIITQDPSNRFVSDTEKTAWNSKAALNTANIFTKTQTPSRSVLSPTTAIDWDASDKQVLEVTLTASRLFNAPTNLKAGAFYSIRLIGAYVPTWNAVFKNISSYTCATTATKADILFFYCSDGTNLEFLNASYNCNGGA